MPAKKHKGPGSVDAAAAMLFKLRRDNTMKKAAKKRTEPICKTFLSIPKLDSNQVNVLRASLQKGTERLDQTLARLKFEYHFDPAVFAEAKAAMTSQEPIIHDISVAVQLMQLMAAVVVDRKLQEFPVVTALTEILPGNHEQVFSMPIAFVLYEVLKYVVDEHMEGNVELVTSIIEHIGQNSELERWLWPAFEDFCCVVLSQRQGINHDLMKLVVELIDHERDLVCVAVHAKLVDALKNYVCEFVPNSVRILAALTKYPSDASAMSLFLELPMRLCSMLSQHEPKIKIQSEGVDAIAYSELPDLKYERIVTGSTFKNGFRFPNNLPKNDLAKALEQDLGGKLTDPFVHVFDAVCFVNSNVISVFVDKFWESVVAMSESEHFFDLVATFLVLLLQLSSRGERGLIAKAARYVLHDTVFNPAQTVFGPEKLPEPLAHIRATVFMLLDDDRQIYEFFLKSQFYPLMFTELLLYIRDITKLFDLEFMVPLSNCCLVLREMDVERHTEIIEAARSVSFSVLCQGFVASYFAYKHIESILAFACEWGIHLVFAQLLERSAETPKECDDLTGLFSFYRKMIATGDFELYWPLFKAGLQIFVRRPYLTSDISSYVDLLVSILDTHPETSVLNLAMKCLEYVDDVKPQNLRILASAVRNNDTPELFAKFKVLLGRKFDFGDLKDEFLIVRQHVIRVITLCYGFQRKVLKLFLDLAGFSMRNCFLLCEEGVSEYLLDLINGNKVKVVGLDADICLEDIDCGRLLLQKISRNHITYPVVDRFLSSDNSISMFGALLREEFAFLDAIPFGTFRCGQHSQKVDGNTLKNGFTVSFWMKCDVPFLETNSEQLNLITLTDKDNREFAICFRDAKIGARYCTEKSITDLTLCQKLIPCDSWNHFLIVFHYADEPFRVDTYFNGISVCEAEFLKFPLSDNFEMRVGWSFDESNELYGFLYNVTLYSSVIPETEITYLAKNAHFRTKDPTIQCYQCQNMDCRLFSGACGMVCEPLVTKLIKRLIHAESIESVHVLLEFLGFAGKMRTIPYLPIANWLMDAQKFGDQHLHETIFRLFLRIQDETCRLEWFEHIILNLSIWKRYPNFESILRWLAYKIPSAYRSLIPKASRLLFPIISAISSLDDSVVRIWNDCVIQVCRERITSDAITAFGALLAKHDESRTRMYLSVIISVADKFCGPGANVVPLVNSIAELLATPDIDLLMDGIIAICQLTGVEFSAYTMILLQRIRRELYSEVRERLTELVNTFPVMYSLICGLCLLTRHFSSLFLSLEYPGTVYLLFPMLLFFGTDNDNQRVILSQFIAYNIRNRVKDFVLLNEYLRAVLGIKEQRFGEVIRRYLDVHIEVKDSKAVLSACLDSFLFRFTIEDNNPPDICTLHGIADIILKERSLSRVSAIECERYSDPNIEEIANILLERVSSEDDSKDPELDLFRAVFPHRTKTETVAEFNKRTATVVARYNRYQHDLQLNVSQQLMAFRSTTNVDFRPFEQEEILVSPRRIGYHRSRRLDYNLLPNLIVKSNSFERAWQRRPSNCFIHKTGVVDDIPAHVSFERSQIILAYKWKRVVLRFNKDNREASDVQLAMKRSTTEVEIVCKNRKSYCLRGIQPDSMKNFQEIPRDLEFFWGKWVLNRISAFRFLCCLNTSKCRSTSCESMYPVMPPVISEWNGVSNSLLIHKADDSQWLSHTEVPYMISTELLSDHKKYQQRDREIAERSVKPVCFDRPIAMITDPDSVRETHGSDLQRNCQSPVVSVSLYYFFNSVEGAELPAFAKDRFDFIYKHRKMLQNCHLIEKWARNVLNFQPKPPRKASLPFKLPSIRESIQIAVPLGNRDFIVLTDKNEVRSQGYTQRALPSFSVCYAKDALVLYSTSDQIMQVFTYDKVSTIRLQLYRPIAAFDTGALVVMLRPCILSLITNADPSTEEPLCLVKANITLMTISALHGVIVIGCDDAKVRIRCLRTGRKISTFDLGCEQLEEAFITSEMGFIFLVTATRFILLSINGDCIKIRTHELKNTRHWHKFTANGIDYILFWRGDGFVCYFEVFYPECIYTVTADPRLCAAVYNPTDQVFEFLRRDGDTVSLRHTLTSLPLWQDVV